MTFPRRPDDRRPDAAGATQASPAKPAGGPPSEPSSSLRLRASETKTPAGLPRGTLRSLNDGATPPAGRRTTVTLEDDGRVVAIAWPLAPTSGGPTAGAGAKESAIFVTSARALAYRPTVQARLHASGLTEARVARVDWSSDVALVVLSAGASGVAKRVAGGGLKLAPPGAYAALNAVASTLVAVGPLEPVNSPESVADACAKTTGEVIAGTPIIEPGGSVVGVAVSHEAHRVWLVGVARVKQVLDALGAAGLANLSADPGPTVHICPACGAEVRFQDSTAVLACAACGSGFPLSALPPGAAPELALIRRWAVSSGLSRGLPRTRERGGSHVVVLPHRGQELELDVSSDGGWLRARIAIIALGGRKEATLQALAAANDRAPGEPGLVVHDGILHVATCEPVGAASTSLREMADRMVDRWDEVVSLL